MARKQKTIHYLYKITCLITGRWYIGMHSTCNMDDGYMGSGKRLRYSIRKYGVENHVKEILEFFENRELLIEAEKKAITEDMVKDINCMNLMSGGTGGFISEEHYNKIRKISSNFQKEKWLNEEYREKMLRILRQNTKKAHENGKFNYNTFTGKKHSKETKEKISSKMKFRGMGSENSNAKSVICYDLELNVIKEYETISETKNDGFNPKNVSDVCLNRRKTHKNHIFKFKK